MPVQQCPSSGIVSCRQRILVHFITLNLEMIACVYTPLITIYHASIVIRVKFSNITKLLGFITKFYIKVINFLKLKHIWNKCKKKKKKKVGEFCHQMYTCSTLQITTIEKNIPKFSNLENKPTIFFFFLKESKTPQISLIFFFVHHLSHKKL